MIENQQVVNEDNKIFQNKPQFQILIFLSLLFFLIGGVGGYILGSMNQQISSPSSKQRTTFSSASSIITKSSPSISVTVTKPNCFVEGYNGQLIGSKSNNNFCKIAVPIEKDISYEVTYPQTWAIGVRGAAGINLYLNGSENELFLFTSPRGIFIGLSIAELPLEESYKAVSRFEQATDSVIGEQIKSHVVKEINGRNTLVVTTSDSQQSYQYKLFQLMGKEYNWLVSVKTLDGITDQSFLAELDQMITSIKLVAGGFPRASQ